MGWQKKKRYCMSRSFRGIPKWEGHRRKNGLIPAVARGQNRQLLAAMFWRNNWFYGTICFLRRLMGQNKTI